MKQKKYINISLHLFLFLIISANEDTLDKLSKSNLISS